MKQYNIYAGLNGGFGGANYSYTTLAESYNEAIEEAYNQACEEYESYEGVHGILSRWDILQEYCENEGLSESELTPEDEENIDELYAEERESWLSYSAVLTSEDDIDEEDLVLGYIIEEDDSTSQTDSE